MRENTRDAATLVERYGDRAFRAAVAILGSRADAEDAVQDAFVKLLEKTPDFESPEHELAWILRVTVNQCKSRLRSFWRRNSTPITDEYPAKDATQLELVETVFALPAKYRAVIHLFYYEGYSTREIAEITRTKETTVRSRLSRAREKLKTMLEEEL